MESPLMHIQKELIRYIQVIQSFFNFDIDICDHKLIRIAGTGRYGMRIGEKMVHSTLSGMAIAEKRVVTILNPAQEEPCKSCKHRLYCGSFARMIFPLILGGNVYGAVSITALSFEQSRDLLARKDKFEQFMETICELINLKVRELQEDGLKKRRRHALEQLLVAYKDGVIVFSESNDLVFINRRGERVLGYDLYQIRQLIKNKKVAVKEIVSGGAGAEYQIRIRQAKIRLRGYTIEMAAEKGEGRQRLFVFSDVRSLHEGVWKAEGPVHYTFDTMIGDSIAFRNAVEACKKVAFHTAPILLSGEVAVGKEMYARGIHNEGPFRNNRFIRIAQGGELQQFIEKAGEEIVRSDSSDFAFSRELLEGNTIYIDEIGDLILENQCIVLALIQKALHLNARIICSTSRELEPLVESGRFHPELYYSLEMYSIVIPPVRHRGADIIALATHYLENANRETRKAIQLSSEVQGMFMEYSWRGNVREIETTVKYLVENSDFDEGEITTASLPPVIYRKFARRKKREYNIAQVEKQLIIDALNDPAFADAPRTTVAQELGVSPATLYRKLKEYGIRQNLQYQ